MHAAVSGFSEDTCLYSALGGYHCTLIMRFRLGAGVRGRGGGRRRETPRKNFRRAVVIVGSSSGWAGSCALASRAACLSIPPLVKSEKHLRQRRTHEARLGNPVPTCSAESKGNPLGLSVRLPRSVSSVGSPLCHHHAVRIDSVQIFESCSLFLPVSLVGAKNACGSMPAEGAVQSRLFGQGGR